MGNNITVDTFGNNCFRMKGKETVSSDNTKAKTVTGGETATEVTASGDTAEELELSNITLRFGATGWESQKALLEAAGYADTPYKVEYFTFQGGNLTLEAMAANQIDLTGTSEIPPLFASLAENGGNFKIILINNSNTQNQELIIPAGSDITGITDLKRKKVGYIKSTTAHYFLYKMLEAASLSWEDIESIPITTADGVTALIGGELDAFASYGNSINSAKANGAATLETAENILSGNFPYEATPQALADEYKRAAIADYMARMELSNQWSAEHVEEWAQISADPSGLTYEENLEILKRGYEQRNTHILPISKEAIISEQSIADAFYSIGLIETEIDVSTLYDYSLSEDYEAALEKLNKKDK